MSQQISLRVHSVKCVDETNGAWAERLGNDEIWLGGYTIAANGDTQVIAPWEVYAGFDDNDVKVFDPPRVFHTFTPSPVGYPQELALGLVLVEKDNGGMPMPSRPLPSSSRSSSRRRWLCRRRRACARA